MNSEFSITSECFNKKKKKIQKEEDSFLENIFMNKNHAQFFIVMGKKQDGWTSGENSKACGWVKLAMQIKGQL